MKNQPFFCCHMWQKKTFQPWKVLFSETCCPDRNSRWLTVSCISQTYPFLAVSHFSNTCATLHLQKEPPGPLWPADPFPGFTDPLWPLTPSENWCQLVFFPLFSGLLTHSLKVIWTARPAFFLLRLAYVCFESCKIREVFCTLSHSEPRQPFLSVRCCYRYICIYIYIM